MFIRGKNTLIGLSVLTLIFPANINASTSLMTVPAGDSAPQPEKNISDETLAAPPPAGDRYRDTTLNWLMNQNSPLSSASSSSSSQITYTTHQLGQVTAIVMSELISSSVSEKMVFVIEQLQAISASADKKPKQSSDLLKDQILNKIEGWLKKGASWEELKSNLHELTRDDLKSQSYLIEFKEEKGMAKVPDEIFFSAEPEEIAKYIWKNFSFEKDQKQFGVEDYWQSPQELEENGKGDCEDIALFAHELLKQRGMPSFLLNIHGKDYGHTVTVFKKAGDFHVLDGYRIKKIKASSLVELIGKLYPFWKEGHIVGYSEADHRGQILKTLTR